MSALHWLQGTIIWDMQWRDAIDILVIWWIAYRTYLVLRGTRALQSMIGLLGLGFLQLGVVFGLFRHLLFERLTHLCCILL